MKFGKDLLRDARLNRGTAFTKDERRRLGLTGLLPPAVETIDDQVARVLDQVRGKTSVLDKYLHLSAIEDENETLFYRALTENLEELVPIVYTPAVGEACLNWSAIYARPRGLYLTPQERGRFAALLRDWNSGEVRVIVVTDGSRILGLGDLGANGMGIPIGKLVLYSACGGIEPGCCLPVMLDVGTNNERLLNDPCYLGVRERRVEGAAYDAMIEEFIAAAQDVFPGVLIQFEDFSNDNAFRLLDRYRQRACVFNDDIQGTGAMVLAGLLAAGCVTGRTLAQERVLFVGAGSANIGIGAQLLAAMLRAGLPEPEARERCRFVDSTGLVVASRQDLAEHKRTYARPGPFLTDLAQIIEAFRPTTLIGATGKRALFTPQVLQAMARHNDRPVVLALSNPTRNAECTAEEAYRHTEGRAIFATGSPSPPVEVKGRLRATAQANNAFIFPGLGLGAVACGARRITDDMFVAAAEALAAQVTDQDLDKGMIFPPASKLRVAAAAVARAVAGVAYAQDLASRARAADFGRLIEAHRYLPRYGQGSSNARVEAASS